MTMQITNKHVTDFVTVAAIGPFVVTLWHDTITAERMSTLDPIYKRINSGLKAFVSIIVMEENARITTDDSKGVAANLMGEDQDRIKGVAVVVESTGFRAAGLRSIVSTLGVIVRTPYALKAFEDVAGAAKWAAELIPEGTASELMSAVTALRRR